MFRATSGHLQQLLRGVLALPKTTPQWTPAARFSAHNECESEQDFDARYEEYFNRADIDDWEIRKAMTDLSGMDLVPDPKIVIAALKACRRLNDYALAIRWLETVKNRMGDKQAEIYPYFLQELRPTLCKLGIETVEELGYDKPELAMKTFFDVEP